jgi:hypothetical protein
MDNDFEGAGGGDSGDGGDAVLAPALASWSDDALTVGYDEALVACRRAEWERLAFEAEIERRRMFVTDGAGSLRSWISTRSGEGDRVAYHQARLAQRLARFPGLSAALFEGRVSAAHVRVLVMLADLDGTGDGDLVVLGERHSLPQLETMCRAARRLSRPADVEAQERRFVAWRCDDSGTFHLRGRLHGTDGLTVTGLLSLMAQDSNGVDPVTGAHDPFDVRCADALVEVCTAPDGSPAERGEVVVHAPLAALSAPGGGGVGMTWEGAVISGDALRRVVCDTRLRWTAEDAAGRAVGIGRRARTIPKWLLGQLRWRDRACRFPGCERTRWLHGHHLVHWADGGATDLDNLLLLCTTHHRAVHEGGWQVSGHPDRALTFRGPSGRSHCSHPATRAGPPPGPVSPNGP